MTRQSKLALSPEQAADVCLQLARKNRPADGFDGQVSVTELPFERRWRLSRCEAVRRFRRLTGLGRAITDIRNAKLTAVKQSLA